MGFVPHVYILRCSDGAYYVGSTQNLQHRLWQHQEGIGCTFTRGRRPVELVFAQEYPTVVEAGVLSGNCTAGPEPNAKR